MDKINRKMVGLIKFELDFDVDNDWRDANETIAHVKNIVMQELIRLGAENKFGKGITFDGLHEDWNDLEYKDEHDRYMDYLMATDPRV